jgi:hypothetical protein
MKNRYRPLVSMKEGMGRVLAYYTQKDAAVIPRKGAATTRRKNLLEQTQTLLPVVLAVLVVLYLINKCLV